MASLPIIPTAAAATAVGAYLSARLQLNGDFHVLTNLFAARIQTAWRYRTGRLNLFYTLEDRAKQYADKDFLCFTGVAGVSEDEEPPLEVYTYRETYNLVLQYAAWLKNSFDVKPGQAVALASPNAPHFVWTWFALWSLGAIPAFINYNLRDAALLHSIRSAKANIVIADPSLTDAFVAPAVKSGLDELSAKLVYLTPDTKAGISRETPFRAEDADRAGIELPDPALLIFTSGTTGHPKAAVVSWHRGGLGARFFARWTSVGPSDRVFTSMPLYHSAGALFGVLTTLEQGATVVLAPNFSARGTFPLIRKTRATVLQYVGETLRYLLAAPPGPSDTTHSLRIAYGNGLRPDVWAEVVRRFKIPEIAEFYSATEMPGGLWNRSGSGFSEGAIGRGGSILKLLSMASMALVELDTDTEAPVRDPKTGFCVVTHPSTPGELIIKLDPNDIRATFQGYAGNDAATEKKILRDVFAKGDAWFRSGDLLRHDSEGRWYFIDRIGDTFRWKSENVSTAEVADALAGAAFEDAPDDKVIAETAVYGVQLPHHDGRAGCAAVVLDPRTASSNERRRKSLNAIARHAKRTLPTFARPHFIRVVKGLETTGTNKFQKAKLQKEGVRPGDVGSDEVYMLKGDEYVPFKEGQWKEIEGGRVRL